MRLRRLARIGLRLACVASALAVGTNLLTLTPAPPAGAAAIGGFGVAPAPNGPGPGRPLFQFNVAPGATISDQFVLVNYTAQPITFALYAADGLNTPVGGGFALRPQNVPQVDVGSWVHVPIGGILVPPHTQDTIPFTMTVPLNAQPGDHAGGIVARDVTGQVQQSGPSQVIVAPGIGVRIYTRVKGPLHPGLAATNGTINGSYGPFAWITGSGQGRLRFRVLNTGNVLLNAQAKVKAVDLLGHTVKSFTPINLPALLPGAVAYLTLPTNNLPRLGRVSYDVSVRAPETSTSTSFQKWLIPWVLIAIVVVLVALIWLWTWWRRRRHRTAETPKPPEPQVAAVR